jgi:tetratricopeptide (TPR) repeat protein
MNRSGAVYRLIHSMTQSEKRYFSLSASTYRDASDYLRMFKVIDEKKIADDKKLKIELNRGLEIKHFAVKKIQLYHLLLKSLRNFHEGRSFDFTLKEMMIDASILSDKALYHDSHSILTRARKIAWEYEEWKILLEVLHKEYTIVQYIIAPQQFEKEILRFNSEEKEVIRQLNNYGEMTYLNMALRLAIRQPGTLKKSDPQKSIERIMAHELLRNEKNAISFRSKSLYFLIRSTYFLHELQYEKAETLLTKHITLYEQYPHFIAASPGNYLNALRELLLVHFRLHRHDQASKIIQHLRMLPDTSHIRKIRSSRFKMVLLSWTFPVELAIALQTGNVKMVLHNSKEQEEYFVRHAAVMESPKRAEIYLALAACYFELKDQKKAILYVQKIFQQSDSARGQGTLFMAHMLQLIIHYEAENFDLLNYLMLAIKRMTAKSKSQFRSEKLMNEFGGKLLRLSS